MIREPSKSAGKTVAKDAERVLRHELGRNQIKRRKLPSLFSLPAADWLKSRTCIAVVAERSYNSQSPSSQDFGKQLFCDISGADLAAQHGETRDAVSGVTVTQLLDSLGIRGGRAAIDRN
jgi:hypothetical protein